MSILDVKVWFDSHGMKINHEVSLERLEVLLTHIATNQQLTYFEIYNWISALRIPNNQIKIIASYEKLFNLDDFVPNPVREPEWTIANISLTFEHNNFNLPTYQASPSLSEAEQYVLDRLDQLLENQNILPLRIYHNTLYMPQSKDVAWHIEFLLDFAICNSKFGSAHAATVFFCLANRLISMVGCSDFQYASFLGYWALALQKLNILDSIGEMYVQSLQYFNNVSPDNSFQILEGITIRLNFATLLLNVESYREANQIIQIAEDLITRLPDEQVQDVMYYWARLTFLQGIAQMQTGNIEQALSLFQNAQHFFESCSEDVRVLSVTDYVYLLRVYVHVLITIGSWSKALNLAEKARKVLLAPSFENRFDLQIEQARVNSILGIIELRQGSGPIGVMVRFKAAEEFYSNIDYKECPDLFIEIGALNLAWATALRQVSKFEVSLEKTIVAEQYLTSNSDINNPAIAIQLGELYSSRASTLRRLGRGSESLENCVLAEKSYNIAAAHNKLIAMEGLAKLYSILANLYTDNGQHAVACAYVLKSQSIFEATELQHRRDLDADRFRTYLFGVALLGKTLDSKWAIQASRMMSVWMELREQFSNDGDLMLHFFYAFHFRWIQYAVVKSPHDIPLAVGAIQGRTLSRRILDESSEYISSVNDPMLRMIINLRRKIVKGIADKDELFAASKESLKSVLRKQAYEIVSLLEKKEIDIQPFDFMVQERVQESPVNENKQSKSEMDDVQFKAMMDEVSFKELNVFNELQNDMQNTVAMFDSNIQQYIELRNQLAASNNNLSVLDPFATFDASALTKRLKSTEALVILLDLELAAVDELKEIKKQYAWILLPTGEIKCKELSLNLNGCNNFAALSGITDARGTVRNGVTDLKKDELSELNSWEKLEQHCTENFWKPIMSEIPENVEHISIVTQGRFHLLPLELGKDKRIALSHFISLVFFAQNNIADESSSEQIYQVLINKDPELTFARRESVPLLANVWSNASQNIEVKIAESLNEIDPAIPVRYLHAAGHGGRSMDRHGRRPITEINLGKDNSFTEKMVFAKLPRADIAWLSSCVVGFTIDDREGDPVGMIVPFLSKGSRFVVASLTAVPDLWMPLLVSLTEWFRISEDYAPPAALNRAKSMLSNWIYDPQLAMFYQIYGDWIRESWRLWLIYERGHGDENPWQFAELDEFKGFIDRSSKNLSKAGVTLSSDILTQIKTSFELNNTFSIDFLLDKLVESSLIPPKEVCDLLIYAVRIYTGLKSVPFDNNGLERDLLF